MAAAAFRPAASADRQRRPEGWSALHAYLHDFGRFRDLLADCGTDLERITGRRLFFVRYWSGGPHLRLRFADPACRNALEEVLREALERHRVAGQLTPEAFYAPYARSGYDPREFAPWHADGSIVPADYVPETSRYGGPAGTPICEEFFVCDSLIALALLREQPEDVLEQVAYAYCVAFLHVAQALGFRADWIRRNPMTGAPDLPSGLLPGLRAAAVRQRPALARVRDEVARDAYYPQYLIPVTAALRRALVSLETLGCADIDAIPSSLLHMSLNRLGISPRKELAMRFLSGNSAIGPAV